ncbi:MAG: 3-oxo-5-alpha-steroid 4-dehydrogenase [Bacteroidetes bacterium HGW-Bacteroidetes-10]|nr:MAG: 3-oxo-5-alpha-steroid 4-dehydrogenase [Bacteroidetes bacterium HGW-Bacteroidetes-10]
MNQDAFNWLLIIMVLSGAAVFAALRFIDAGYGMLSSPGWGKKIPNKTGWLLMEAPVFVLMLLIWYFYGEGASAVTLLLFSLFMLHYLHRAFIYPLLLVGKSKMPLSIVLMGCTFNVVNAAMQGGWLFIFAPDGYYLDGLKWLSTPQFIAGILLYFTGMAINIDSDRRLRKARREGALRGESGGHYIPAGGLFRRVTSANYFGEIVEWSGFAIMCWSLPGAVFAWWTFANLVPRAASTYRKHKAANPAIIEERRLKRVFPYIY